MRIWENLSEKEKKTIRELTEGFRERRYLTRREFLKLLATAGILGTMALIGIGTFDRLWALAQETLNPPPRPRDYDYGELNYIDLTITGTPLAKGLVAEYLFYEGSGNVIHDTSGNRADATLAVMGNGSWEWKQLPNGKYYVKFTGGDEYGGYAYAQPPLKLGPFSDTVDTPFAMFAVAHTDDLDLDERGVLILNSDLNTYNGFRLEIVCYRSKTICVATSCRDESGNITALGISSFVPEVGKPYFLGTQIRDNVLELYINGNLYRRVTAPAKVYPKMQTSGTPTVQFAYGIGSYRHFLNGGIYAAWVFQGRELTNQEVQLLYRIAKLMVPWLP